MRVVLTNCVSLNGGDAAILISISSLLRAEFGPNIEITVLDSQAGAARLYYPDLDFRQMPHYPQKRTGPGILGRLSRRLARAREEVALVCLRIHPGLWGIVLGTTERAAFRAYRRADLVISTGGTYLVEHYDLRPRIFALRLALAAGKRPIFFTQSLGPFLKPYNRRALAPIFNASPLVLLRDRKSAAHLTDIGVDAGRLHVSSDVAFALGGKNAMESAAMHAAPPGRIAVSVRYWPHFAQEPAGTRMEIYMRGIAKAVEVAARRYGCQVAFISTCQGIREYWMDDSKVADQIASLLPIDLASKVSVDHGFHHPIQLLDRLSSFDLVISTRMHMAILALSAGVPVLPIAYEFKTDELFSERFQMSEWVTGIDTMTEDSLADLLPRFLEALPSIRARLFAAVGAERRRALGSASLLRRCLEDPMAASERRAELSAG